MNTRKSQPGYRWADLLWWAWLCWLCVCAIAPAGYAQTETDLPRRQMGQDGMTRAIAAGETHHYYVKLDAPHYFRVQVYQDGAPTLYGPDGQTLDKADLQKDPQSVKSLICNRCAPGVYRIEIRLGTLAGTGQYSIGLGMLLPDTEAQRRPIEADRNEWEGWRLHETETEPAYREAIGKLRTAAALWQELGNIPEAFDSLMYLGEIYHNLSEYQAALDVYRQVQGIIDATCQAKPAQCEAVAAPPAYDPRRKAIEPGWTYNNIGKSYSKLGETGKALEFYERSIAYARQLQELHPENRRTSAPALTNLGELALSFGEKQKAFTYLTQGLADWRQTAGGKHGAARALMGLGEFYRSLGEDGQAQEYFEQALKVWQEASEYTWQVKPLVRLGQLYRQRGEWFKARESLSEAVRVAQLAGNRDDEAAARANLGYVFYAQQKPAEAVAELRQAQRLAQETGSRANEAFALTGLGLAAQAQGQTAALAYYEQALTLRRAIVDREGEAETLYHQARALDAAGRSDEARQTIEKALVIVEEIRAGVVTADLRAAYVATFQDYYEFHIGLLMRLHARAPANGYDRAALVANEHARARSLRETLAVAGADIHAGVAPELLARERAAAERLRAKADYLSRLSSPNQAAQKEVAAAREDYRQARAAVEVASPRYAALTQTPKFTADDINALLGPDTLLLEYALGREQSYLWAVTAQETRAFTLPPRSQIETQARHCYDAWATGKMPTDGAADKLSQMLLGPASRLLGRKRLLIVGEGMLQYVPFAALPEPDTAAPLIVRHEITTLPSALTLAALRRETVKRNAPQQLTAFILADPVFDANDPRVTKSDATQTPSALPRTLNDLRTVSRAGLSRLPATRAEAQALSKLLPPAQRLVTLDFAANYAAVTDPSLSNYRILHFATHGIFDATRPELSGLALSLVDAQGRPQNGFLWAHEIYNLNLPAELVVLSACRTALGQDVKGEGLMSLTRGFMYAGAARVVASLWEVNDPATAALMADFYKNMLRRRMRPAAALRAAQIAAWRKRLAPHLWAAFTIQGEYR